MNANLFKSKYITRRGNKLLIKLTNFVSIVKPDNFKLNLIEKNRELIRLQLEKKSACWLAINLKKALNGPSHLLI